MYDQFRLDILRELVKNGLDNTIMQKVMGALDMVSAGYEIAKKETALVPFESESQRLVMEYLACKSLEGLSKLTLSAYRNRLKWFMGLIQKPINEATTNDIRAFLYQYQSMRHISNRTLDSIRTTLNSFFSWAHNEGRISINPCAAIQPIKYTATPRTALSQLEMEYIRRACGPIREKAIVEMLYSTGCRVSELCGIRLGDIDWDARTVQVFGKGGKYRTCFINAKAYVTLKDYLASRNDDDDHLIVSERKPHQGLGRFAIEKIVSDISDRAYRLTGKRVTPHIFRHTTATTALQAGMPVQNVSRMLGHAQIETTMIYAEINNNDLHRDHMKYVV